MNPLLTLLLALAAAVLAGRAEAGADISAGAGTSHVVDTSRVVRSWGDDSNGQLGLDRPLLSLYGRQVFGLSNVTAVTAGYRHSAALVTGGFVATWGSGEFGQLGDGSTTDRTKPGYVPGLANIQALVAGSFHTLALRADGTVVAWGSNGSGALGDGTLVSQGTPVAVVGLSAVRAIATSADSSANLALRTDGTVWSWGNNFNGQLGDGTTNDRNIPAMVAGISGATAIAMGTGHAVVLRNDGTVWTWGTNTFGELGNGTTTPRRAPGMVPGLSSIVAIAAGTGSTFALRSDGAVWAFGRIGPSQPQIVQGLTGVVGVVAGPEYVLVLKSTGLILAWGANEFGMLGDGTTDNRGAPVEVSGLPRISQIAGGGFHALALGADGRVYAWGSDSNGQLGTGYVTARPSPSRFLSQARIVQLADGRTRQYRHVLALDEDGQVWAWGSNVSGQVGDGSAYDRSLPVRVPVPTARVVSVAAGALHSLAVGSDGTAWAWGDNRYSQLGDGTTVPSSRPKSVPLTGQVAALSAGFGHTVLLNTNGRVFAWGANEQGQVGDGTTTLRSTPVAVTGLDNVTGIVAGSAHTLALKSDGSVWAWGYNNFGQLGDGTNTNRGTPVRVQGLANVAAISAGAGHSLFLKTDGTVWAVGWNNVGQLGDGTTLDRSAPVRVGTLSGIVSISAGEMHNLAKRSDGTVVAWGSNSRGELGDGTFTIRARPVVVAAEGAAGSIATNDWFIDLDPATGNAIPAELVPPFLAVASADPSGGTLDVSATVRFRTQDVGRPYRIFAYAPLSAVRAASGDITAKDDGSCTLAQLTPAGLQATTATSLTAAGNVTSSQNQAVSVLNNVAASQVAGATFCVGTGSGTEAASAANSQCVVTVPGTTICVPPAGTSSPSANVPGALSGLWWNAAESGWGVHFTQRRDIVFAAWYTYDAAGSPKWYVASDCRMAGGATGTSGTCSGSLYEVSGPTFFGTAFNPAAAKVVAAGTLSVSFQGASTASMTYGVGALSRTVAITRQSIATGAIPGVDYTDLWWNAAESGWGLAIAQQSSTLFLAWYVYDGTGKPVWYVASSCVLSGTSCTGTLYRTTGPPLGPSFNPAQVQVITAGSVTVTFTDGNNGTISYTVNGVTASKSITRQLF